jgi:hypothetical protein
MKRFWISMAVFGLGFLVSVAQADDRGTRRNSNDRSNNATTSKDNKNSNVINTVKPTHLDFLTWTNTSANKNTFSLKVGSDGFKSDLIKHNSRTKYFGEHKVDAKYKEKFGKTFTYKIDGKSKTAFCYPGKHHHHWDYRCWNEHYRCWFYWDPCTLGYFFWYPRCNCWAPVSCSPDDVPDCSGDASDGPDSSSSDVPPPPDDDNNP